MLYEVPATFTVEAESIDEARRIVTEAVESITDSLDYDPTLTVSDAERQIRGNRALAQLALVSPRRLTAADRRRALCSLIELEEIEQIRAGLEELDSEAFVVTETSTSWAPGWTAERFAPEVRKWIS